MLKTGQQMNQKQTQQQRLSPQQIQYIKLLQLPTVALEQRIKEEIELNPVLEEAMHRDENEDQAELNEEEGSDEVDPLDEQQDDVDWDEYMENTEYDSNDYSYTYQGAQGNEDWRDMPDPYHETLLEELENQIALLDFNEEEKLVADQIVGSLDEDGYFRREITAVVDNIAFNKGVEVTESCAQEVLRQIQKLEPTGIASRDLQECLTVQLKEMNADTSGRKIALEIVKNCWQAFEKKHFDKLKKQLNIDDEDLKEAFDCVKGLDPKPGGQGDAMEETQNYIEPDFTVEYEPGTKSSGDLTDEGDFIISLNNSNVKPLKISPRYKKMWNDLKKKKTDSEEINKTKGFIKEKINSAQWFINSIKQRQNTLMNTMQTIVALQETFFKTGAGLKPMILKDIAERVNLDISTISRVVNGKYVQTKFGVFELKYFFSEGLKTTNGEIVSNREVKNSLLNIVDNENKRSPLNDSALAELLQEEGYKVARRTVSKYRKQLNIPVARLRKQI